MIALLVLAVVTGIAGNASLPAAAKSSVPGNFTSAGLIATEAPGSTTNTTVVRVYYNNDQELNLLASSFDLLEYNNHEEKYVLAVVVPDESASLEKMGFRIEVDLAQTAALNGANAQAEIQVGEQTDTINGYACYRTVEETYQTAQDFVSNNPTLASWSDVGDTWEKATLTSPDLEGYDMMVLKLTNSEINGEKPKLFITASIHAREYTPAELTTRFAEYLVTNYNTNADVTWLLDYHEIHLMFHANPDGRKIAETGISRRKNTDSDDGCTNSSTWGTDLNRNFNYQFDTGGSSDLACDDTYHGPSGGSEPETAAIQNYILGNFPDQRGTGTTAAPATATGIYLDIHSSGSYVMWPWAYSRDDAPNMTQLRTLGRKFAYFNNYTANQIADQLYIASGSTVDFSYGELGIASYAFELGTAFFQDCPTFENTILPTNLNALVYAAKVARTPYMTSLGPDALSLALSNSSVSIGTSVALTATINDTRYRGTVEPTQNISSAEYYIDTPPWVIGAVANSMTASDGSFNTKTEGVTANINTSSLNQGRHILFVRGLDTSGNWGAVSAIFLTVFDPLSVEIKSFTATGSADSIVLNWETVSESDNLGFNLYRAETYDGGRTRLNTTIIPSPNPGSPNGESYQYIDADVVKGISYYYWLENEDIFGATNLHGPVSASVIPGGNQRMYLPALQQNQ